MSYFGILKINRPRIFLVLYFSIFWFAWLIFYFLISQSNFFSKSFHVKPKLTVFIIVDQMGMSYINKIKPFISGGLDMLTSKGMMYNNVHIGHAMPSTAPGHTAFNMGSYPCDHGIVGNKWIDKKTGLKVACDQDDNYRIFSLDNQYLDQQGKSPNAIHGSGLSESCALTSSGTSTFHVYAISGKSRGAICTANKLGKALWFDEMTGDFTSSTYYFNVLPDWLVQFNKEYDLSYMNEYTWKPFFDLSHPAYNFPFHDNYEFTAPGSSFINKTYPLDTTHSFRPTKINPSRGRFCYLQNTPFLNNRIFECAKTVIQNTLSSNTDDRLLLWLSLSSLDKVGHIMGPSSNEALDTLYHLDAQLEKFFNWIDEKIGLSNTLIIFTSDHGMTDIPEISFQKGIIGAERISEAEFIDDINEYVFDIHGILNAIQSVMGLQLHLNESILSHVNREQIENSIVAYLKQKPYIQNAWSVKNLKKYATLPIELAFKRQIYQGRTGQIMFQLKAHKLISHYPDGASHESPYSDDTHIPLIFYQKGVTKPQLDTRLIYAQQVANTVASLLGVPQVQLGEGRIILDLKGT